MIVPASAAAPTNTVAPDITYATDAGAFLKGIELSQSKAWNLTIKATDVRNTGNAFAVILRYRCV